MVTSWRLEAKLSRCVSKQDIRQFHLSCSCHVVWHRRHGAVEPEPWHGSCWYVQELPRVTVPCSWHILGCTKLDRGSATPSAYIREASIQDFNFWEHLIPHISFLKFHCFWVGESFFSKLVLSYQIKQASVD